MGGPEDIFASSASADCVSVNLLHEAKYRELERHHGNDYRSSR